MGYYEMLYILSPSLSDEEREELIGKFNEFIVSKGGKVISVNKWGKRSLAYPIKKNNTGYYILSYAEIPAISVRDVKYFTRINEGFLRVMILKKERPAKQDTVQKEKEEVNNVVGSK